MQNRQTLSRTNARTGIATQITTASLDSDRDYLAMLKRLTAELDRAMQAIVHQDLPPLQESLECQHDLCARLLHRHAQPETVPSTVPQMDPPLTEEIRAAKEALVTLNRQYAALLTHTGNTLRLFAGLFRNYHRPDRPGNGLHSLLQTWSCDI